MIRTTILTSAGALLWLTALPVSAETVDEVIAKHIAARGGQEAWDAVQTVKATGTFTGFSQVNSFILHRKRGNQYHLDHILGDKPVEIGFDGEVAWWINLWRGIPWPQKISGLDHEVLMQDVDIASPFFDYREKGYEVELLGEGDLEGQKAIKLQLERPAGPPETWYLDPETYLEIGYDAQGSDFGRPMPQRAYIEDFRDVGGLMIPHYIEKQWYTRNRVMEIEEIATNVEIDDTVFSMPLPGEMQTLQAMVGDWEVKVEQRDSPQAPWSESTRTSKIESKMDGALLEERFSQQSFQVLRTLTYDRFKERYRLTQFSDFTSHLDVQEGVLEDGRLTTSNAETGTAWTGFGRTFHQRLSIFDVSESGFKLEVEQSVDGGENWFVASKATYYRKSE
ncbi:MAG: DUF1579 family protein [Acidobacteriota bacterium]